MPFLAPMIGEITGRVLQHSYPDIVHHKDLPVGGAGDALVFFFWDRCPVECLKGEG